MLKIIDNVLFWCYFNFWKLLIFGLALFILRNNQSLWLLSPESLQSFALICSTAHKWFYLVCLPIITILLSCAVLITNNPVFSLFFLISLFLSVVLLLFSLHVEFLAMIYLIIYIGAISILFLFVIMMFNLKQLQKKKNTFFFWSTIFIYGWAFPKFYTLFINNLHNTFDSNNKLFWVNNLQNSFIYQEMDILIFSQLLYTYYSYLFLISGMILLTAMLGSIILALSTVENTIDIIRFNNIYKK